MNKGNGLECIYFPNGKGRQRHQRLHNAFSRRCTHHDSVVDIDDAWVLAQAHEVGVITQLLHRTQVRYKVCAEQTSDSALQRIESTRCS